MSVSGMKNYSPDNHSSDDPDSWKVGLIAQKPRSFPPPHVGGYMTLAANPPRERGRELRINEKIHAGCRTA